MEREEKRHKKDMESKIPEKQQEHIYNILPINKTMSDRKSIKYIQIKTNWDEDTIVNGLNDLIKKSKVISVYDKYQNVYVTKNPY